MAAAQPPLLSEDLDRRNRLGGNDCARGQRLLGCGARLASRSRLWTVRQSESDRDVDGSRSDAGSWAVCRCCPETALDGLVLGERLYGLSRRVTIIELSRSFLSAGGWQPGLAFPKAEVFRQRFCDRRRTALAD